MVLFAATIGNAIGKSLMCHICSLCQEMASSGEEVVSVPITVAVEELRSIKITSKHQKSFIISV